MKSKSLLIIGGSGFFGKSILKYFSNHNYLKIQISKIFILSRGELKLGIYNKKLKKNFKIIKINSSILKIKSLPIVDYVIYAAILKNYNDDHQAVKKYLDIAKKYHQKAKILYISSGAVYGKQSNNNLGFKENYLKFNKKINFKNGYKKEYSKIKKKNEKLFEKFAKAGRNVSIARCFSFVGEYLPRDYNYVVGNCIQNILDNKNINIKANYRVMRSYMYEKDLVIWLLKILNDSNQNCPIYNVGSNNAISIHKLVRLLAKKYNLGIDYSKTKFLKYISDKYIPNIDKAKKKLKLNNNHSSLDAIIKTINIIKKNEKIN